MTEKERLAQSIQQAIEALEAAKKELDKPAAGMRRLRTERRSQGLCAECGLEPSKAYRCQKCRRKAAA